MLHLQIRDARIASSLSQSEIARRAKVQRRDVRKLENGENVTLATVRKIVAAIPSLSGREVGFVELIPGMDPLSIRKTATEMVALGTAILSALDARIVPPLPDVSREFEEATAVSPAALEKIQRDAASRAPAPRRPRSSR
jgi:DNA-binding XRE family transcriptional regulator